MERDPLPDGRPLRPAKRVSWGAVGVAGLALGIFGVVPEAHAALQYVTRVQVGSATTIFSCVDNAACDADPTVGIIDLGATRTIAGVVIRSALETSAGTIRTPGPPPNSLDSSSDTIINTNHAVVTVTVAVSDTDFIGPAEWYAFSGSGLFRNAIGASVLDTWWNDPRNDQGADTITDTPGNLLGSRSFTSTHATDAFSFNQDITALSVQDGLRYSMSLAFTVMLPAAPGTCTSPNSASCPRLIGRDETEIKSPEPASLALLGAGLVGLSVLRRKRR